MSSKLRMSGLISGMDTESIISALVSTRQSKVDKTKGEQTKLTWKQDTWKDLNKELKSLQSSVGSLRFSSSFAKRTTAVSNPNKASVITSDGAPTSVQSLKIDSLAKTAYLTGGTVTSDKSATALTTLGELGFSGNGSFSVTGTDKTINVDSSTTISDVLSQLQDAGLNASFDAQNQRLFISAKNSGTAGNFDLVENNGDGAAALAKLGLKDSSYYTQSTTYTSTQVNATVADRLSKNLEAYKTAKKNEETLLTEITELQTKYGVSDGDSLTSVTETANTTLSDLKKQLDELDRDDYESDEAYETAKTQLEEDIKSAQTKVDELTSLSSKNSQLSSLTTKLDTLEKNFDNLQMDEDGNYTADASAALVTAVEQDYAKRAEEAANKLAQTNTQYAHKIEGVDAKIYLNGAEFTSNSNVFSINGLTITAMGTTEADEEITLTTQTDTSSVYDMIKSFIKSYNTIVNKLDALYNADDASSYSMLTDEEKEELSEKELEKYEQKIKDSLLRRDSTVGDISNALVDIMSAGVKVGDKSMYLSDFGINTLEYFTAAANEKHAYHIDGDSDDTDSSGNEDKLKALIASEPDTVVSFFSQLSQNLYSKMSDLSSSINGFRSFGSFYEDKQLTSDISSYTSKISDLEEKLSNYEDKLYKQYSAMETALAKLQSNSSAVTGLLGQN